MNRAQIFPFVSNLFCLIFVQTINSQSSDDCNLLRRPPGDLFVCDEHSNVDKRIAASSIIVDCQIQANDHIIIAINEGIVDDMPNEFLANGIETSDEIFEVITMKTSKAPLPFLPFSINATHVLCDRNNENCRYFDFSSN